MATTRWMPTWRSSQPAEAHRVYERAGSRKTAFRFAKLFDMQPSDQPEQPPVDKRSRPRPKAKPVIEEKVEALLKGGNPQIAKAGGDAPVQAYIAAMPGWKRDLGKRLDALIVRHVPNVRKAVKWNSPFYGIGGQEWFLSFHVFTRYVKVSFFRGTSLQPVPPGGTPRSKEARWIDLYEGDELDEAQWKSWVKQAAALRGWNPGRPS